MLSFFYASTFAPIIIIYIFSLLEALEGDRREENDEIEGKWGLMRNVFNVNLIEKRKKILLLDDKSL